jgi:hypothetical protein
MVDHHDVEHNHDIMLAIDTWSLIEVEIQQLTKNQQRHSIVVSRFDVVNDQSNHMDDAIFQMIPWIIIHTNWIRDISGGGVLMSQQMMGTTLTISFESRVALRRQTSMNLIGNL